MPQILGVLTVSLVVYMLYLVSRAVTRTDHKNIVEETAVLPVPPAPEPVVHAVETIEDLKVSAPIVTPLVKKAPVVAKPEKATLLRNPADGETVGAPSNYRFAKKWIKQALVAEGLLDKIYKNSDLDEENAAKVKTALEQFRSLEKYRA